MANQYVTGVTASSSIPGFPTTNALIFSNNILDELVAKNSKQTDARYDFTLSSSVFVYTTVLIGDPSQDFKNTKDWYITAGTGLPLANPSFASYASNEDKFGLETPIKTTANIVSFIRSDDEEQWNMAYAAVFANTVDCTNLGFNWVDVLNGNPYRIKLRLVP